ncbi:diacylglycerol kinase family protein [Streptococcus sp. E17BB]|uniref:diacylglycerol kinase family protein n=1 Tax=Streptococcus sp. E17BB TaxID=3278714 RepID=UPI00359EF6C4
MDLKETDVKVYQKSDPIEPKAERQKWKNSNFINSFEFAWSGIKTSFVQERNMRKHVLSAAVVLLAGLFFKVSTTEWLILLLCIFGVICMEIVNSAIENVVDLASDYHFSMRAKNAKDMAAGAVLMMSFLAVIVGFIIFLPKLWALFS